MIEYGIEVLTVNGGIVQSSKEVFPDELLYYIDLVKMVYKKQCWDSLSDDARIIINWLCWAPDAELLALCGTPKLGKVTEKRVAMLFRKKWGYLRVKAAIKEIKKFISI